MKTFGERLQFALELRGVSQHALARSTGLTSGEISRMVRGERGERVQYSTVATIARALLVDVSWLGDGHGPSPSLLPERDPIPRRADAIRICREAGIQESAVDHARSVAPSEEAAKWTTLEWIMLIQLAASAPAPPTPMALSRVRPRANNLLPPRSSTITKK